MAKLPLHRLMETIVHGGGYLKAFVTEDPDVDLYALPKQDRAAFLRAVEDLRQAAGRVEALLNKWGVI